MGGGVVGGGAIGTVSGPWLLGYAGPRRLLDCSKAKTKVELPFRSGSPRLCVVRARACCYYRACK